MKRPIARPTGQPGTPREAEAELSRTPRAFAVERVAPEPERPFEVEAELPLVTVPPALRSPWPRRFLWGAASLIVSLALGLAADSLIRELFARAPWLGWLGVGAVALFIGAALIVLAREVFALRRLQDLQALHRRAANVLQSNDPRDGHDLVVSLSSVYGQRPDLAKARETLSRDAQQIFDGSDTVRHAERVLMTGLDARARALTAASARRVAVVTAVSPRALIDMGFVVFESIRLGGAIARLYGARPGLVGSLRLTGAILSHLAVTGGILLTDGFVEQLVGQGAASRLSARLGEGVVNGLMTVRVGIAAMRAVRPLPFAALRQPVVKDFIPELVNLTKAQEQRSD